ncbi:hypothetical protein FO519_006401 [Halicephalobus sp. NKZ332]|nr:hypothetical protein FO519_006401 [Halicephalobus sp. NKZ332]
MYMDPWFQAAVSGLDFLKSRGPKPDFDRSYFLTKKMANSNEKLPPGTLCIVCEDLATGNHYNVASCSGCKTFFRRAVNNRTFACIGNGNCPVNKDVRCACRHCRFRKCLEVGMNKNAIQNDRDRIGYTKRTRRKGKAGTSLSPERNTSSSMIQNDSFHEDVSDFGEEDHSLMGDSMDLIESDPNNPNPKLGYEPLLERLAQLENNFSLLLSRGKIEPYASLDEALAAPSKFNQPISTKITDPIATPADCKEHNRMPFWRSRIIALYIDWAKTFFAFRKLPYADRVALITNHASSYMIMCEAFRTPEHKEDCCGSKLIKEELDQSPDSSSNLSSEEKESQESSRIEGELASCTSAIPGSNNAAEFFPPSVHAFFDPELIKDGNSCIQTGVRSVVDVPPTVHYPTVGNLSGLTPVMAVMIDYVMKPFRRLNISTVEFATLQAIMFFDPDTDGLDSASQRNVAIEQKKFISALFKHISSKYEPYEASERYSAILLRIPTIRKVAAKKNESLQIIDMFNLFSLNALVKETTLGIRQPPNQLDQMNIKCSEKV